MADLKKKFDNEGFFRAVEGAMIAKKATWKQVSDQTDVGTSTLSRMKIGRQPDAASLAALAAWAGINPADFVQTEWKLGKAEPLTMISQFIASDPRLSKENAQMLDDMVKSAYRRLSSASESEDTTNES